MSVCFCQTIPQLKGMKVNGKPVAFRQKWEIRFSQCEICRKPSFTHSQEVALQSGSNGSWSGSLVIPSRIIQQLVRRRELWPIPWTKQDYDTAWLVPERLLLFVQFAEPDDKMEVKMSLDGSPLELKRAYSSVREHPASLLAFMRICPSIEPDATSHNPCDVAKTRSLGGSKAIFLTMWRQSTRSNLHRNAEIV